MTHFVYQRTYRGPLQAVLLDWAGTTLDYGCYAPAVVFMESFKRMGVPISMAEARGPMGTHKKEHIRQIMQIFFIGAVNFHTQPIQRVFNLRRTVKINAGCRLFKQTHLRQPGA